MDKNKKLMIPILSGFLVLVAVICLVAFHPRTEDMNPEKARAVYMQAALADFSNVVLVSSKTQEITVGSNTVSDTASYTVHYKSAGAGQNQVQLQETLTSGKHTAEISEVFHQGTVYTTINESRFSCEMKQTEYLDRLIPAVLISPDNYKEITGIKTRKGYEITFNQGVAPEAWCCDEEIDFVSSSGSVFIQHDGKLASSTYSLTYTQGEAQYHLLYQCEISEDNASVQVPENTDDYIAIRYLDGIRALERASGYLTQLENISSKSKDVTYFQAFGDRRTQAIELTSKITDAWTAKIQNTVTFANDGRLGADSVQSETRLFENGAYTLTGPDGSAIAYRDITEEDMQLYCQNLLVNTLLLPQHIRDCTAELTDGVLRITYTANEDFGLQICNTAYKALYPQSDNLDPESSKTKTVYGYLELDAATGIPLSSGIYYDSVCTVDSIGYQLLFQADQTYTLIDNEA